MELNRDQFNQALGIQIEAAKRVHAKKFGIDLNDVNYTMEPLKRGRQHARLPASLDHFVGFQHEQPEYPSNQLHIYGINTSGEEQPPVHVASWPKR